MQASQILTTWNPNEFLCLTLVSQTSRVTRLRRWINHNTVRNNKKLRWHKRWSGPPLQGSSKTENHEIQFKVQQMVIAHQASIQSRTAQTAAKFQLIAPLSSRETIVPLTITTHKSSHFLQCNRLKTSNNKFGWITWILKRPILRKNL